MLRGILTKPVLRTVGSVRCLNLHEYQSKTILNERGCTVQRFFVAESVDDAEKKLKKFHSDEYVVKAQILAGGRGKGRFIGGPPNLGGVFITKNQNDVLTSIHHMLGKNLVTKQTGKTGLRVNKVIVAESIPIKRETYVAIVMDREYNGPVIIASPAGGMNIEEIAEKSKDLILKEPINIIKGITPAQSLKIAKFIGFYGDLTGVAAQEIERLYKLFIDVDATQVEINPLVETDDGKIYNVDAKLNFDESAAFRQKDIFALNNHEDKDMREVDAKKFHLNYIGMDGNIACLVNGAGLAMATMDIIKHFGGFPANFLDVGGTVTEEQVFHAFRIISFDPNVKGILVNIFGGIVNCATIANGIIKACNCIQLKVPLIVRLEGTNVNEAKRLLVNSGLPIISADNLEEAAKKAIFTIEAFAHEAGQASAFSF